MISWASCTIIVETDQSSTTVCLNKEFKWRNWHILPNAVDLQRVKNWMSIKWCTHVIGIYSDWQSNLRSVNQHPKNIRVSRESVYTVNPHRQDRGSPVNSQRPHEPEPASGHTDTSQGTRLSNWLENTTSKQAMNECRKPVKSLDSSLPNASEFSVPDNVYIVNIYIYSNNTNWCTRSPTNQCIHDTGYCTRDACHCTYFTYHCTCNSLLHMVTALNT